jgi:hypothetical protein
VQIPDSGQLYTSPLELGFVIDQSASMDLLANHLVKAFNTLLSDLAVPGCFGTLILFNNVCRQIADGVPIAQITKLSSQTYQPAGNTALLDAIGKAINQIGRRFDQQHFRTLIAIFTDGFENVSQFFTVEEIAEMVRTRQTLDAWQFILITPRRGFDFGRQLGIPRQNMVDFEASPAGIAAIIAKLSKTIRAYRLGDKRYFLQLTG